MAGKNIRAILNQGDTVAMSAIDDSAHVIYDCVFCVAKYLKNEFTDINVLNAKSVTSFEWTNEANTLYLTGKIVLNDVENIMLRYYNTYSVLGVNVKKSEYPPNGPRGALLQEFDHVFILDRFTVLKQSTGQSANNDVLVYEITLKSAHLINLLAHVPFSNWNSSALNIGNYGEETDNDVDPSAVSYATGSGGSGFGKAVSAKLKKQASVLAHKVVGEVSSKLRSSGPIAKLMESVSGDGTINTMLDKLGINNTTSGLMAATSNAPVKVYSIIKKLLVDALEENKKVEEFKFMNFDEVFGNDGPEMKYCAIGKDTVLDAVRYLQQKLFSLKLPKNINGKSELGLTYISYNEFKSEYRVIEFKNAKSFILQEKDEPLFDIIQLNGSFGIVQHIRKLKVKLLPPKQPKFQGTVNYLAELYHDAEYLLNEDQYPDKVDDKNFSYPSSVLNANNELMNLADGITKVVRESNSKIEFLKYDKAFDDINPKTETEQNIASIGKDVFGKITDEKAAWYTNIYSEDFDNQSYVKTLETTLNKNSIVVSSTGKFFSVPGMLFILDFDEAAGTDENYYTQFKNTVMHITKVTHKFFKAPGRQEEDHYAGEEITLCKI